VHGGIIVKKGASLFLIGSDVRGHILALAPGQILACGNNIHGSISVVRATGLVTIGDLDGSLSCAANTIAGTVWLQHNTDGVQVSDNTVYGGIHVAGTTGALPPPDTGALDMQGNVTSKWIAGRRF
jgi:hypothetical protein